MGLSATGLAQRRNIYEAGNINSVACRSLPGSRYYFIKGCEGVGNQPACKGDLYSSGYVTNIPRTHLGVQTD